MRRFGDGAAAQAQLGGEFAGTLMRDLQPKNGAGDFGKPAATTLTQPDRSNLRARLLSAC
jgi:hypothetical protein